MVQKTHLWGEEEEEGGGMELCGVFRNSLHCSCNISVSWGSCPNEKLAGNHCPRRDSHASPASVPSRSRGAARWLGVFMTSYHCLSSIPPTLLEVPGLSRSDQFLHAFRQQATSRTGTSLFPQQTRVSVPRAEGRGSQQPCPVQGGSWGRGRGGCVAEKQVEGVAAWLGNESQGLGSASSSSCRRHFLGDLHHV